MTLLYFYDFAVAAYERNIPLEIAKSVCEKGNCWASIYGKNTKISQAFCIASFKCSQRLCASIRKIRLIFPIKK